MILSRCFAVVSIFLLSVMPVFANEAVTTKYQKVADITVPELSVPAIVEVPLPEEAGYWRDVAVFNVGTNEFVPSQIFSTRTARPNPTSALVNGQRAAAVTDGELDTYTDVLVDGYVAEQANFSIYKERSTSVNGVSFYFGEHTVLPRTVSVSVSSSDQDNDRRVVLTETPLFGNTILFDTIEAKAIFVTFEHSQPLRIEEIRLHDTEEVRRNQTVRFLAQPGAQYRLYADSEGVVMPSVGESANFSGTEVTKVAEPRFVENALFVPSDIDDDGVIDKRDNCLTESNSDQQDINGNGRGDACDDYDKDGVDNIRDNCINEPNRSQFDEDGDGIGDTCDGKESRFTEAHAFVPWVGIGLAGFVLILLFALVARDTKKREEKEKQ